MGDMAEKGGIEPGSRSTCLNCSESIVYDARDGWIHPDLVGVGVLGGDGVACDVNPVAEPGDAVTPPELAWSCCGHAAMYHGPEVPGCAECRCARVTPPAQVDQP